MRFLIPFWGCRYLFFLLFVSFSFLHNTCKNIRSGTLYSALKIYECLNTIPFSSFVANRTIESASGWMQSYAFLDFYKEPIYSFSKHHFNIIEELNKIKSSSFESDYQFQMTLWDLFRSLQDSHTLYLPPEIYQEFQYCLPVGFLTKLSDQGELEYFVVENSITPAYKVDFQRISNEIDFMTDKYPIISSKHIGMRIIKINGEDPTSFLLRTAEELTSTSKDIHIRFNSIVTGGFWNINAAV